ncbi:MAG: oxidoreductase, partial [Chitinophagales bacterium]
GYRSAVAYLDANRLIACGTSGIDISEDGGKNWKLISREAYHVCKKAKKGNTIFLAGPMGKIAKLVW